MHNMTESIVSQRQVVTLHNSNVTNASEWARMLAGPATNETRAPSMTPFLASSARFVTSFDVTYDETVDGTFSVIVMPDADGTILQKVPPGVYVPTAQTPGLMGAGIGACDLTHGYLDNACVAIKTQNGVNAGLSTMVMANTIDPLFPNIPVFPVELSTGETLTLDLLAKNNIGVGNYQAFILTTSGTLVTSPVTPYVSGLGFRMSVSLTGIYAGIGVGVRRMDAIAVNLEDVSGTDCLAVDLYFSSSQFYNVASNLYTTQSLGLDQVDRLGLQRCVAQSILVTNMSPPLVSGGELVMARTTLNNVLASKEPLPSMIKQLPEELSWRSGNATEGGYAWWIPSSLEGYEPRIIGNDTVNQNLLVACGNLAQSGGILRVIVTSIFEFYTPAQLFKRSYNCLYTQAHYDVWEELVKKHACSANIGHMALIAGIASAAKLIKDFYIEHQDTINTGLSTGYKMLKSYARSKEQQANPQKFAERKKKLKDKKKERKRKKKEQAPLPAP